MIKKLKRFPKQGYIGGVCHGMGEHTGIDPILWRILSFLPGFALIYLILLIVLEKGE